jgi:phage shock protein PspC (stress-responsive transcriptional regulator)
MSLNFYMEEYLRDLGEVYDDITNTIRGQKIADAELGASVSFNDSDVTQDDISTLYLGRMSDVKLQEVVRIVSSNYTKFFKLYRIRSKALKARQVISGIISILMAILFIVMAGLTVYFEYEALVVQDAVSLKNVFNLGVISYLILFISIGIGIIIFYAMTRRQNKIDGEVQLKDFRNAFSLYTANFKPFHSNARNISTLSDADAIRTELSKFSAAQKLKDFHMNYRINVRESVEGVVTHKNLNQIQDYFDRQAFLFDRKAHLSNSEDFDRPKIEIMFKVLMIDNIRGMLSKYKVVDDDERLMQQFVALRRDLVQETLLAVHLKRIREQEIFTTLKDILQEVLGDSVETMSLNLVKRVYKKELSTTDSIENKVKALNNLLLITQFFIDDIQKAKDMKAMSNREVPSKYITFDMFENRFDKLSISRISAMRDETEELHGTLVKAANTAELNFNRVYGYQKRNVVILTYGYVAAVIYLAIALGDHFSKEYGSLKKLVQI